MRKLFTDGYNSFWHVVFGMLGYYSHIIIVVFIIYQLATDFYNNNSNYIIDIAEGLFGFMLMLIIHKLYYKLIRFPMGTTAFPFVVMFSSK